MRFMILVILVLSNEVKGGVWSVLRLGSQRLKSRGLRWRQRWIALPPNCIFMKFPLLFFFSFFSSSSFFVVILGQENFFFSS